MMKKIFIVIILLFGLYLLTSYILLNGRITYTTSFCSQDKIDSKKRELFKKDNLRIEYDTTNLVLKKIINENDIWVEKQYDVNYFGFIFNYKVEDKDYSKLRFECKNSQSWKCEMKVCDAIIDNDTIEKSRVFPISQMGIRVGKTVKYNVYEYNYGKTIPIGKLSVKVE
ncbi:hypothetical protein [Flavobacterium koreense]